MNKFLLFLILFFCGSFLLQAQVVADSSQASNSLSGEQLRKVNFDRDKINEFKSDKAFEYVGKTQKDSWWTRFKRWVDIRYNAFLKWLFGDYRTNAFWSAVLAALPYLFLILIVIFITWLFIKVNPGKTVMAETLKARVRVQGEEEILRSAAISSLTAQAIKDGNFRLAVRYLYLESLRELDQKKHISYKFQKTNEDYIKEIASIEIKAQFIKITRLYDYIWYGDFHLEGERFKKVKAEFSKMHNELNNSRNG